MAAMKRRHRDSSRGTTRLRHLPSLSPPPPQSPQPPSTAALYAANLKDEALYLSSILRARLSDSANGGDGRGLLSRALARGELDQFLVAFFSDPENLLFAREKVEARRAKIANISARRLALVGHDAKMPPAKHPTAGCGAQDSDSNSVCSSTAHQALKTGPQAHHCVERSRFGPVLADSAGKFNLLPARDVIETHIAASVSVQRDDVSELGSTASRAMSEHNGSDSWHAHGQRGHDHRQRQQQQQQQRQQQQQQQQQQQNETESVQSCSSLRTFHSESQRSRYTNTTSVGGSTVTMTAMDDSGHRREKQKQRRKKRDRDRNSDSKNSPLVSGVESVHFEGHLLHRVCEVTGRLPGGGSSNSDSDSDDYRSEMFLLEDSGEHQLARLRRSPEMMNILVRLKALSVSLADRNGNGLVADPGSSGQPGDTGSVITGRRLGVVQFARQQYLRLFEEMLGELLKVQREKSKAFRMEKLALQKELERARGAEAAMKDEAEVHAVQLEALLAVKKALAAEVATQEVQLKGLEAEVEAQARVQMVAKQEHFAAEAKKAVFLNELKQDEETMRTRFEEVEVEATRAEMGIRSMQHLTAKVERTAAINKKIYRVDESKYKRIQETTENCCQTMANDDGLWDYQDGLTRQVSRNVFQRLRWQALRRFASCPSCHGLGPYTTVGDKDKRELAPCKDRAKEDPTLTHQHFQHKQAKNRIKKKKGNLGHGLDKAWAMPNVLVEFMCHLPKTAMALPVKPLQWLIREIWLILEERERIDAIDEQEGQKVQDMNDFMVELFLGRHSLRQDAELQLYIFLVSVKAHYKRSAAVHTFARLMDLLNDPWTSSNSSSNSNTAVDAYSVGGHDHDLNIKGKHSKDKRDKEHFKREEELLEQAVQPHNSPLGSAFIPVLLFTRRALLKRPKVDMQALRRERIRRRFTSAASLVRLQKTVMRTLKGFGAPPDGQHPLPTTNEIEDDDSSQTGAGGIGGSDEATAASSSGHSHSHSHRAQPEAHARGKGLGGETGGGARADARGAPRSEEEKVSAAAPAAMASAPQEVAYNITSGGTISSCNTTSNTSISAGMSGGSGAPIGGSLDRKKSVAVMPDRTKSHAVIIDRGNKKRATPATQRSSAAAAGHGAGHGLQGSTKKSGGSSNAAREKSTNANTRGSNATAEEHHQEKGLGAEPQEAPVEAIDLPKHVLTEDNCTFWVSLEMSVRVLTVALHWCNPMKRHAYMRSIEKSAALLTSRGHITGVEASHSFIRSAMRKTIAIVEAGEGADTKGDGSAGVTGITETMGGISGTFEEGCGVGGVVSGDAALHEARIIIDMDRVIELVMEVMLLRQNSIEHRLKALFTEGDDNGDGVLSFEEFNQIVSRAAPHFSERRVLRMFREALTSGSEGSYAIEKDTFCNVCRQHGLVQLIDIAHLEKAAERGPSGSTGLRLLSNMASPPGASRTIAATRVPALAPTKTKLDMAVGVPLGVNLNDSNDANDAESCSTRGGRDRDSCDGDVGVGVDGDEQQSQGEDEDEDYDGEDVLLSSFDSDSAPVHLLFEEGDANKECRK